MALSAGCRRAARVGGALGAVLLVSAPLTYVLTGAMGAMVWAKLTLGGLLLAAAAICRERGAAAGHAGRARLLTALSAGSTVLALGAVVAVNALVGAHPRAFDFTAERLYTLTAQSVGVLQRLQQDVEIWAFYAHTEPAHAQATELLGRYRAGSRHVRTHVVSPQARPDLVERYQITDRGPRLVVTGGGREARAKVPQEPELTAAIVRVAEQAPARLYLLAGHGEGDVEEREAAEGFGQLHDALAAEGYALAPLDFARAAADPGLGDALTVPHDAAAVVVLAPRRQLAAPEVAALSAYLEAGGRVLALLEPHHDGGLAPLLARWRIAAADDVIVDTNPLARLLGLGAAAPMVHMATHAHPVVDKLGSPAVMHTARSLTLLPEGLVGVDAQALAHTGETAWGETALGADGAARRDAADHPPPLDVLMAATRDADGERRRSAQGRLVVAGDADWLSNRYLAMQGNQDLALNAVAWAAEHEEKITIRPPRRAGTQLLLSGRQLGALKFLSMDLLPVLLTACGLGVVLVRRQA